MGLPLLPPGKGAEQVLTGTWSTSFAFAGYNSSGTVSGTVSESSVSATMTPGVPGVCPLNLTGTLTDAAAMTGSWTYTTSNNCIIAASGTFAATKQ